MTLFINGTTVYYGGTHPPFERQGTVIGRAEYDGEYHYAIRGDTNNIFTRPGKMVSDKPPATALPEYVAAYIDNEIGLLLHFPPHNRVLEIEGNIKTWVANAFEAYEEGAR